MISEFVTEWFYWLPLIALTAIAARLLGARLFDFQFLIVLLLAQYVVHSVIAFGATSRIAIFCTLFFLLFMAFSLPGAAMPSRTPPLRRIDVRWIQVAKLYLVLYYLSRLILYPYLSGEFLIDVRLEAQQENPLLFTLGLAVQPALAACVYSWFTSTHKLSLLDKATIVIVAIGLLGSGSKAAVLPMILVYVGVASYLGRSALQNRTALALIAAAVGLTLFALSQLFPDLAVSDIALLMQYRIAANTDNLEYLLVIDLDPNQYPFSGVGALFPLISKRFGYGFEFPPGAWLHGMRFGDWSGFGPNSGIVMDYLGNLGWFGLAAAAALGAYVRKVRDRIGPIHCSFLSVAYIVVIDIGIFDVSLIVWGGIWAMLMLTRGLRLPVLKLRLRRLDRRAPTSAPAGHARLGARESPR